MAPGVIPYGHVTQFPLKVLEEWASSDFLGKDQDYDYYSTSIFLSCVSSLLSLALRRVQKNIVLVV